MKVGDLVRVTGHARYKGQIGIVTHILPGASGTYELYWVHTHKDTYPFLKTDLEIVVNENID
tara:strand:- start:3080 stop:3265 length:186 start_codon:yes stop_codon:yes gene_type:complete